MSTTTLNEILMRREERSIYQKKLTDSFRMPLICFQINIPGFLKYTSQSSLIHAAGTQEIYRTLNQNKIRCFFAEIRHEITGIEGFFIVDCDPVLLKKLCCEIEENHVLGRLFDIDVMDDMGNRISRVTLGYPERSCLICGGDVLSCRREMKHTSEAYSSYIEKKVMSFLGCDASALDFYRKSSDHKRNE